MRYLLERDRTPRAANQGASARPLFPEAVSQASRAGLDEPPESRPSGSAASQASRAGLDEPGVDAMHMVALVEPNPEGQMH